MNFSREYLYGRFRTCYGEALSAKGMNDLARAKKCFYEAADYLGLIAGLGGEERDPCLSQAERLRAVADAIVPANVPRADVPVSAGGVQSVYPVAPASEEVPADMGQFFTFYLPGQLAGFESVIGLEAAKEAVTDYVINPVRYPEAYNYSFLDNKAILLEGPPGTGKTTFAKAVAHEIRQPFALINVARLVNCYVGETGKNIDRVFAFLRDYAEKNNCGVTVFFDEFDEIAKRRGSDDKVSEAAVPALLRNLDGVRTNKAFLILANTNRKDMLDPAIAERFRKLIYIPLPDMGMREKLFAAKLADVEPRFSEQLDLHAAAEQSEGLSGRDISFICDDLKYRLSKFKAGLAEGTPAEELFFLIRERMAAKGSA